MKTYMIPFALVLAAAFAQAAAVRAPLFSPESFTMLNIVPFSPGREELAAKDMVEYEARTGNQIALYSLTLHPEGKPASDKVDFAVGSYHRFAKALEGTRVRPGILLQAIVGHWTSDAVSRDAEPWQRSIDIEGRARRYCPLDTRYQRYIRETAAKLAREAPCLVLSDDDVRAFSPKAECFCPLHTAEFNARTGRTLTPDAFRALIAKAALGSPEHTAFTDLQKDTVLSVCRALRAGFDSVDPGLPAGVCMPGWVWDRARVADYARAMAAAGQAPFFRFANGQYTERSPKVDLAPIVLLAQSMLATPAITQGVENFLDEADTWPHNLWSKSSAAFHAKLLASAFIGLRGAKLWFVNCHKQGYPVSRHYTDILARHRGDYAALAKAASASRATGFAIPCHPEFPANSVSAAGRTMPHDDGWVQTVFGAFGMPYFATCDLGLDAPYALAGKSAVDRFSDAQLRQLLSRRLLVDGDAAEALCKRGLGEFIGVSVQDVSTRHTTERDEATGIYIVCPKSCGVRELKAANGAETLSSLVWKPFGGSPDFDRISPSATLFANSLGGHVLVTAYHMHMGAAYQWSEARKAWLLRLVGKLDPRATENVAAIQQNAVALARRMEDGADLVYLCNANYDAVDEVAVMRSVRPAKVETLELGEWRGQEFRWADGVLTVARPLPCYDTVVMRIR